MIKKTICQLFTTTYHTPFTHKIFKRTVSSTYMNLEDLKNRTRFKFTGRCSIVELESTKTDAKETKFWPKIKIIKEIKIKYELKTEICTKNSKNKINFIKIWFW